MSIASEETSYKVEKLNVDNYYSWKFNLKMYLVGRDLWEIVDGTEMLENVPDEASIRRFRKRDNQALSIICLAVSTGLQIYIRNANSAKEAWDSLADHFEEKTLSKQIELRKKLYSIRLVSGSSKTMIDHINEVKTIAEHLESVEDPVRDKDLVKILITSLPPEYNNLLTTLETLKAEALTWNYIRDRLINEYDRKKSASGNQSNSEALLTHGGNRGAGGGNSQQGQGSGAGSGGKKNKKKKNFKCHYCHKKGHFIQDCEEKAAAQAAKNQNPATASIVQSTVPVAENVSSEVEHISLSWTDSIALVVHEVRCSVSSKTALAAGGIGNDWWIDSGATDHMTGSEKDFVSIGELEEPRYVTLADKSIVPAAGVGDVNLVLTDENGEKVPVTLKEVLYVPKLKMKLVSVSVLDDRGAEVSFKSGVCTVTASNRKFTFGHKVGKLYRLSSSSPEEYSCNGASATGNPNSLSLWHLRLGHLNTQDVKKLASENMVEGIAINPKDVAVNCEGCSLGKQSRVPFPKNSSKKKDDVLQLVHSDVCGPLSVTSVGGSVYFVTYTDDFSNYLWVYMLKQKSDVPNTFIEWLTLVENQTDKRVKEFRSDNGGEYISKCFTNICKERGIATQPTIPYTPQQNGLAERVNRTILDNVRATLYHAKLPLYLWAEAVAAVVYCRNRSPTSSLKGVTPFEKFFTVKPNVEHLRVFGCAAYVHVPDQLRRKLDPKSKKGVFVGYPEGSKGYKIFIPETRKMIRSRDVKFLESSLHQGMSYQSPTELYVKSDVDSIPHLSVGNDEDSIVFTEREFGEPEDDEDVQIIPVPDLARPVRNRRNPDRYGEWVMSAASVETDPKTYKQATKSPNAKQWESAMLEEISSLEKHKTWDLVDLPEGKNLVGCKWVFKTKRDANGDVDRFKARLVAQGYSQEYGVDYDEVFAPVARYDSIRSVLAIGSQLDLEIHQMDVKSAFLNGELDEEIFMRQPVGFEDKNHPEKVCRLNTSLYGLKQSARCWNLVIDSYLKSEHFKQNAADPCVYYKHEVIDGKDVIVIVAVYVDDSIICSNVIHILNAEKKHLSSRFEMDDRGEIHYILGMTVNRDRARRILTIDQKCYLQNVLLRFGMENCKPMSTPVDSDAKFVSLSKDEEPTDVTLYQAAIGSLNYAAICTRPDLSTAVGILSKFMQRPGKEHWVGIKRVLRYIKGTLSYGLVYSPSDSFRLLAYSDSDWAGCVETRKSTSGYVSRLGNCTISWRSKKQPIVALSSTEAEYIALCAATQEIVWLRRLLEGVDHEQGGATVVYKDNQGAMSLSRNPKDHSRTKHIDVKYHFVRENVEKEVIDVVYIPTAEMLADSLTKGLAKPKFEKFREAMGVLDVSRVLNLK
jgi:hypothetical protein